jgi:phage tail sheath gpL-like
MGAINLTGIPADYALPGNFIETNLGVGAASGSDTSYPIILIGNKTAAGSATPDTVVYGPTSTPPLQTEQDCINIFGTGSEVHREFLRVTDPRLGAGNKTTAVFAIAVTESAGTAATLIITWTGTAAAPGGSTRVWVGSEFVDVPVNAGDTPTVIAAAAAVAINAKTKWAVTATSSVGALTILAKNKGPRGNWLRGSASISAGITTTVNTTAPTFFTTGATADDNTAALTTLVGKRFYYYVSSAEDATQFGAVCAQIASQALPAVGSRQRAFAGYVGTQANAITISTGINGARDEYIHSQNNDWTPLEIAAFTAAVYAMTETKPKPRHNYSGFGNGNTSAESVWKIPAPRDGTTPSPTALNTAIKNGLTPIGVNANGTTYIVKRCTTRCLNGAAQDFRSRDAHKVTVTDFFADDWYAKLNAQFSGKDLTDDPSQGQHVPGSQVATPKTIKGALVQLLTDYNNNDQLQGYDTIVAGTVVQREVTPTTRASCRVPFTPIDILDQTTTAIDQQ